MYGILFISKYKNLGHALINICYVLIRRAVSYSRSAACVSTHVTNYCEPRQARKGATVAVASGAKGLLAQVALLY